jgi:phosphoglycerate kinase
MFEDIRCIDEMRLLSQRLLVRIDLDGVVDDTGALRNEAQLVQVIPTLKYALEQEARVIVATHRGQPHGKRVPNLSLEAVGIVLADRLGCEVLLPDECAGDAARKVIGDLRPNQVCLLENLRFEPGEENDDEAFAHRLVRLCDAYVNDAFSLIRSKHTSVHALPRLVQNRGMGFALRDELTLVRSLREPERPLAAVIGGVKLGDVLELVDLLLPTAQALCFGGAVANTLLAATGHDLRASRIEEAELAHGRTLLEKARSRGVDILLPSDAVVSRRAGSEAGTVVDIRAVPEGQMVLDIGPETVQRYAACLAGARTAVFWGPMGLYGNPAFAEGTRGIARALGRMPGVRTVALGAVAASAARAAGAGAQYSVVSPSNDAVMATLLGKRLPALEVLRGGRD